MKSSIIKLFSVFIILFGVSCKTPESVIQYLTEDNNSIIRFPFKMDPTDSTDQLISLFPQAIKKKGEKPMFIQIEFKGQRKCAEKLISMNLKLYTKNEKTGLYDLAVMIKNTYAHYDYPYYSYNRYGYGEKNYTSDLNKLMFSSEFNTEDRINSLFVDNELELVDYPKQVRAVILVKWIGGEQEFSKILTLDEREAGSKVRTNPFG